MGPMRARESGLTWGGRSGKRLTGRASTRDPYSDIEMAHFCIVLLKNVFYYVLILIINVLIINVQTLNVAEISILKQFQN